MAIFAPDMSGFWQKKHIRRSLALFALSLGMFFLYMYLYTAVLGWELPKTRSLRRRNAALVTRAEILSHRLDEYSMALNALELRDEDIYRSIFGLNSISKEVREGGMRRDRRYSEEDEADRNAKFKDLRLRADVVMKKAYVQSKSYDEIEVMLNTADNMSASIPAICPIKPDKDLYRISSSYGYRRHPILGYSLMHKGMDFALKSGSPVYSTGDGTVESIKMELRGYGRQVVVDHGFGYKTRYAHLKEILVTEGMKVTRGEQIATSGNTGLSSGPHLHYEVMYKGRNVNPAHYFDSDLSLSQYEDMLDKSDSPLHQFYIHPSHRK